MVKKRRKIYDIEVKEKEGYIFLKILTEQGRNKNQEIIKILSCIVDPRRKSPLMVAYSNESGMKLNFSSKEELLGFLARKNFKIQGRILFRNEFL